MERKLFQYLTRYGLLSQMRNRAAVLVLGLVIVAGLVVGQAERTDAQSDFPLAPRIYSGTVTVAGVPAPDGLQLGGRILNYQTPPVEIEGGSISSLS